MPLFFSSWHDGNDPTNPEIVGPVTTDELEQEERKLTPEEEKEQRMLEEHLEYQRQIENEAKQKRLAELNKAGAVREIWKKCPLDASTLMTLNGSIFIKLRVSNWMRNEGNLKSSTPEQNLKSD